MGREYSSSWQDNAFYWNMIFFGNIHETLTILTAHGYDPSLRSDLPEGVLPDIDEIKDYFESPSLDKFRELRYSIFEYVKQEWRQDFGRDLGATGGWNLFKATKKQTLFSQTNPCDRLLVLYFIYAVDKLIRIKMLEESHPDIEKRGVSRKILIDAGLWMWELDRVWSVRSPPKKMKRDTLLVGEVNDERNIVVGDFRSVDDPKYYIPSGELSLSEVAASLFRFIDPGRETGAKSGAKLVLKKIPKSRKRNLKGGDDKSSPKKGRRGEKDADDDDDDESTSGTKTTALTEASMSKASQLYDSPDTRDKVISALAAVLDGDLEQARKFLHGDDQDDMSEEEEEDDEE